jgi:XRE family aerobic/anaerobic benzoate catabolism transcriptional regulator
MIALVGLRGAGKTAIGRRIAAMLGVRFVEQDELVERAAGLPLATIFAMHGEAYYRRVARDVLAKLLARPEAGVLATGGGVVTDAEAWALLRQRCRTVWLRARPEDHWGRVLAQGDLRPGAASANAQGELRALLEVREPLYAQAELTVDTSSLGVEGAAEAIVRHVAGTARPATPLQRKRYGGASPRRPRKA